MVSGEREAAPLLDPQECRLGRWLDAEGNAHPALAREIVSIDQLHQQQHARCSRRVAPEPLGDDFGANQWLDAGAARCLVKLDRAKQVVEIGDSQRRLRVGGRRGDHLVNAIGAVDDGKFSVQAQVDKHALHCSFSCG